MTSLVLAIYVLCQVMIVLSWRAGWLIAAVAIGLLAQGALAAIEFDWWLLIAPYAVLALALTVKLISQVELGAGLLTGERQLTSPRLRRRLIEDEAFLLACLLLSSIAVYQLALSRPIIDTFPIDLLVYLAAASILVTMLLTRSTLKVVAALILGVGAVGTLAGAIVVRSDLMSAIIAMAIAGMVAGYSLADLVTGQG